MARCFSHGKSRARKVPHRRSKATAWKSTLVESGPSAPLPQSPTRSRPSCHRSPCRFPPPTGATEEGAGDDASRTSHAKPTPPPRTATPSPKSAPQPPRRVPAQRSSSTTGRRGRRERTRGHHRPETPSAAKQCEGVVRHPAARILSGGVARRRRAGRGGAAPRRGCKWEADFRHRGRAAAASRASTAPPSRPAGVAACAMQPPARGSTLPCAST